MNICAAALALALVELHGPTGQVLDINPALVSSLRMPIDTGGQHWGKNVRCILVMSYGGFVAVAEDCALVVRKLGEAK